MTPASSPRAAAMILFLACGLLSNRADSLVLELAEREWLPEVGRQQLAAKLTEGFHLLDDGTAPASDEEWAARGRRALDSMALRVEQIGVEALIEEQPTFEQVTLPATNDRFADAIAAWGACALPLHRELATDAQEEFYVLLGEVQVVIVSAALRMGAIEAGTTDERLAQLLRTETMDRVSYEIQVSEPLRAHVNERCSPALGLLLDPPTD